MQQITIVGAGPVGALMALLLARRGYRVQLRERRPDPRSTPAERGRSINLALSARGLLALRQAGILDRASALMIPMPGRMLHEGQQLEFQPYGQNEREVNYSISRTELNRVIVQAAGEHPAIELHFNQRCTDLEPQSGLLTWRDEQSGQLHSAPTEILLAADGAGSSVRHALVARGLTSVNEVPLAHDYKELTLPSVPKSRYGGYAFESHALHIWPRGGFMLIALPNSDHSFTATLFLPRHGECSFETLRTGNALHEFFEREFPDAAALIPDLSEQLSRHPQSQLGTIECQGWCAGGRVLLMGDAAHAVVPFHGQGLNCGFEDCVVLDELLAQGDFKGALAAFEHRRQPNTKALAEMALENYIEMRDDVRSSEFAARKALASALERSFPGRFIPRYSMVTFHPEIPYAEAQRRGQLQQFILDRLTTDFPSLPESAELSAQLLESASHLLAEAGL